jgi:TonB family protein
VSLAKLATRLRAVRFRWAVAFIALLAFACSPVAADQPALGTEPPSANAAQDPSGVHHGAIPTRPGLQLTVKADCANVQIFTDALNSVSYAVQPDPGVAGTDDPRQNFGLTVRNTSRGVMLIGQTSGEADCRDVTLLIHVPRRYDLDIAVGSGNIVTQDVEGLVALSTGGGEIRAGNIGVNLPDDKVPANAPFVARLETAGGDICAGNIAGGIRAATAGGQISAGDVHGPAVLRTGGGDIHVGHVFGAAHFVSGGGDIVVQKADSGLWADTAGGRVEIGNAARPAAALESWSGTMFAFPTGFPRYAHARQEIGMSNLADINEFGRLFDAFFWGGIRVDPADQQKRMINSVAPEYPEVARLAGIEGDVTLRIFVAQDGTIRDITPVSGPPVLVRAAMHAVEKWRYAPALLDGHPVDVVSTVTLAFRLHF